jgi:hypothetical protein
MSGHQPLTRASTHYTPTQAYCGLRDQVLRLSLEPHPLATSEPIGVITETGLDPSIVTLVALADGTTTIYFSSGGGVK